MVEFLPVDRERDRNDLVALLCGNEWPFHGTRLLTTADVDDIDLDRNGTASFWIVADGNRVGLVRLFDLDDVDKGSPLFDLRLAATARGQGYGRVAVRWLTDHLFSAYPTLHRIEANTRADNVAMQRIFATNGYQLEGRLRESWPADDGTRFDTWVYGVLRTDPKPD